MWDFAKNLFKDMLSSLFELLQYMLAAVLDALLAGLIAIVTLLPPIPGFSLFADLWASMPVDGRDLALRTGFAECTAMLVAALLVKIGLRLIPFVRLG